MFKVGKAHAYMAPRHGSRQRAGALQEQFYTEGCCSRDRDVGGERVAVATIVQAAYILFQLYCTRDNVICKNFILAFVGGRGRLGGGGDGGLRL